MFELLHEAGEAEGIPFTVTASARATGTDADAFHISRAGIPTGVVSVPLRYMHSPVEMVQLDDVENAARLIAAFALRLRGRHGLQALGCSCCSSTSTARCCSRPPSSTRRALREAAGARARRRRCSTWTRSSTRAGPTPRSRAICSRRAGVTEVDARWAGAMPCSAYERLCPADLSAKVAPGMVELLEELAARPDEFRLSLVTGNLEPIARLKLERAGVGRFFARRPGRVRLRSRGSRAAAGDRARARLRPAVAARADGGDRRHAARHRVRAGRTRCASPRSPRGRTRSSALADADAVVDDARALLPVLSDWT